MYWIQLQNSFYLQMGEGLGQAEKSEPGSVLIVPHNGDS